MTTPLPSTASPANIHTGGKEVSVSYLKDRVKCHRYFFWRHVFVWPTGERGIEPKYPTPRKNPIARYAQPLGSAFHAALEAWRRSDVTGGQYDRDAAMAAARANLASQRSRFESDDDYAVVLAELEDLTLRYCAKWKDEYPDVRVAIRDGEPMIEKLFEIPLGDTGYLINVRPDALVYAHGYLAAHETKTASAQRVWDTWAELENSPQTLAEMYVLRMSGEPVAGVYGDVAVKGGTRTVEKFQRKLITPDDALVDAFPSLAMDILAEIGEATAVPTPSLEDALATFPMTGMFGHRSPCSGCEFAGMCWNPGREVATLGGFRARTRLPTETTATEEPTE